jgi:hypothetical protein
MRMARRVVAWAVWTCNTCVAGQSPAPFGYTQKERASARSFFCAPGTRVVHARCWIAGNRPSMIVGESQEIDLDEV